jgi:hypothetical protein
MGAALEDVAAVADEVAAEQRLIARRARSMQRERDRGVSWASILAREPAPGLLELTRNSACRLSRMTTCLAHVLAAGLSAEGESRRAIAGRLGVSHQRITAMLRTVGRDSSDGEA